MTEDEGGLTEDEEGRTEDDKGKMEDEEGKTEDEDETCDVVDGVCLTAEVSDVVGLLETELSSTGDVSMVDECSMVDTDSVDVEDS